MENPVRVMYDLSTDQNVDLSAKIITILSDRGIYFGAVRSIDGTVSLSVDEHKYSAEYINEHEEDVFKHAKEVSDSYMKRRTKEIEAREGLSRCDR